MGVGPRRFNGMDARFNGVSQALQHNSRFGNDRDVPPVIAAADSRLESDGWVTATVSLALHQQVAG